MSAKTTAAERNGSSAHAEKISNGVSAGQQNKKAEKPRGSQGSRLDSPAEPRHWTSEFSPYCLGGEFRRNCQCIMCDTEINASVEARTICVSPNSKGVRLIYEDEITKADSRMVGLTLLCYTMQRLLVKIRYTCIIYQLYTF